MEPIGETYKQIIDKQVQLIAKINAFERGNKNDVDAFKRLYDDIVQFNAEDGNRLIPELEKEQAGEQGKQTCCTKFVRLLLSMVSLLSIASLFFNYNS